MIIRREHRKPVRLPLPDLTADACRDRAERYTAAMNELTGTEREEAVRDVLDWLWRTVAEPVLAALDLPSDSSRVWWVPTGPLTTLPLHAAAPRDASDGASLLGLAVSSYVPTMYRLVTARQSRDDPRGTPVHHRRLLLVTPDTGHLPATARTHARLRRLFPRTPSPSSPVPRHATAGSVPRSRSTPGFISTATPYRTPATPSAAISPSTTAR